MVYFNSTLVLLIFFFLGFFFKVLIVFNFTIQIKFIVFFIIVIIFFSNLLITTTTTTTTIFNFILQIKLIFVGSNKFLFKFINNINNSNKKKIIILPFKSNK